MKIISRIVLVTILVTIIILSYLIYQENYNSFFPYIFAGLIFQGIAYFMIAHRWYRNSCMQIIKDIDAIVFMIKTIPSMDRMAILAMLLLTKENITGLIQKPSSSLYNSR